ncbi:methylmalonyl Co-A mutase-associated GTPase MeaB [Nocardia australiensis]|uniref:methylmalonyl Co-A mutase-associated GTPase MeaB n=1 Tax=Nocardia australiensis TaxID=2887191 RepID=UPI001D13FDEB|nr:methylmalonyl Co-A mutase-associated GTPase MeaB [Nocardia australiensis]
MSLAQRTPAEFHDLVVAGDHVAVARAISLVENGASAALHSALFPRTGRAFTIGITGPPGAGKSTLVDQLAAEYRKRGLTVGVLAVDPSSPFTRGALLGDRVRMRSTPDDQGLFIRSMANRGHVGGLALAAPSAIRVLDAAGFDRVLVETVGVGQSEVDVVGTVDCTVVVEVPGLGDVVQTMKAGLMEIADRFVVNKADREGASRLAGDLRRMVRERHRGDAKPTVTMTQAQNGTGVDELADSLEQFRDHLIDSGALDRRREENLAREVAAFVGEYARRRLIGDDLRQLPKEMLRDLRERTRDPEGIAAGIVDAALESSREEVSDVRLTADRKPR